MKKVLIVGGVAGGATAAARLRRLSEDIEIILFEKGQYISFANCGLPYYIGEVIKEKEKLVVQTPEKMKARFNIDIRINSEVTKVFPKEKMVQVLDGATGKTYTETYDKLVLSPGAEPFVPGIEGVDSDRIFTLRNIPDTYRIKDFVDNKKPRRAVVIGAGFIGLEVAENLHKMGVNVTIVELADHMIGPLDYEMAAIVHQHLKSKNVEFYLKDAVKAFKDTGSYLNIELTSGRMLKSDMAILGIGVRPDTRLAKDADLKIGKTGGIFTDEFLRTSDPDIYAVGDAIEVQELVSGNSALIPLAGPANKQGRIAADNIMGLNEKYKGTQGTSIVKVFDITVAVTGNSERMLRNNGVYFEKSFTHSPSHAGYYPGAIPMSVKLMFGKDDGKILGAQIIGYDGVDKRIDVLATAIRAGMTVYDLKELELAYAPPYSSAKDPVNIAGYTAANILTGDMGVFHWDEIRIIDKNDSILLDVRDEIEYSLGTIEGAVNIPLDQLRDRLAEIPRDKEIYLFCQVGLRGYLAYRILSQKGFKRLKNLSGGYKTYQLASQKQSNEDIYEYEIVEEDDMIKSDSVHAESKEMVELNACGLQCPGPIMKVFEKINEMAAGSFLKVTASDPAFERDIQSWCSSTGNRLVGLDSEKGEFRAVIQKGMDAPNKAVETLKKNNKTMVVFSADLDRAIASFIIANGAAAMGRDVTMFFTFWGLNILRKPNRKSVKKDLISRAFGMMMPKGSKKLALSNMNMLGMGPMIIRNLMKKKNVPSLEELIESAVNNGVKIIACSMSMDIMGIKREELIDDIEIAGVAAFLNSVEEADMGLFI